MSPKGMSKGPQKAQKRVHHTSKLLGRTVWPTIALECCLTSSFLRGLRIVEKPKTNFSCIFLRRWWRRKSSSSLREGRSCYSMAAVEGKSTPSSPPELPWHGEMNLHHLNQHLYHHLRDQRHPSPQFV
jgi:hypothetical protein